MSFNVLESKFRRLAELREERDIAKAASDRAEKEYREYEAALIEEIEDSNSTGPFNFDFGDLGTISFSKRSTIYGRVEDKELAMQTFRDEGLDDAMTTPKIESRRLNEYVKECFENGKPLGDGVGFYERKFISISRK